MRPSKLIWMLCIYMLSIGISAAQHRIIGIPRIVNYNKFDYQGAPQNWMITNGPNGLVYFANNDGMLEFDGTDWNIYKSLKVVNRAVLYAQGRIYTGGFSQFGYYKPDERGNLVFHDISQQLHKAFIFGDIWKIYDHNGLIYFQSNEGIFIYNGKSISIIKAPSRFDFMYIANGTIFVNDSKNGILKLKNNRLKRIDPKGIARTKQLSGISPLDSKRVLISTIDQGLFVYDGQNITPWDKPICALLKRDIINTEQKINGYHCFGTILNGLYVVNDNGEIILHLNQSKGLTNNTVQCIGHDEENNIWAGLNNGLAKIEISSALSYIGIPFKIESVYTSAVWHNNLYIGTNSGLYKIAWNRFLSPMKLPQDFQLIKGTEGQVWNLNVIDGNLLCGHNNGVYVISDNGIEEIEGIRGGWLFIPMNGKVIVGNYSGLAVIEKAGGKWRFRNNIKGFGESSRFVETDSKGNLWVSHGYKGIYRLTPSADYTRFTDIKFFGKRNGLPSNKDNAVWRIDGKPAFSSISAIYNYNPRNNKFEVNAALSSFIDKGAWISYVKQDSNGDIWISERDKLSVLRLQEDGKHRRIDAPFYPTTRHYNITFEHVNNLPNQTTLIGLEDGFAIYDASLQKSNNTPYKVHIKSIVQGNTRYNYSHTAPSTTSFKKSSLPLTIKASAPFKNVGGTQYSFRLIGYSDKWSAWSQSNTKEYTNLFEGKYTIQARARNYTGETSETAERNFTILPPWYRTAVAYAIYIIILLFIALKIKKIYYHKLEKSRQHGAEKQKQVFRKREEQLINEALKAENEVIRIKNENLQDTMKRKERELTLSTMHIIQKNEIINKVKAELHSLQRSTSDDLIKKKTSDIIKKVSKDVDNKSEWRTFELHLEQVHEDFINRLKDKYPELTARELRLCVYLKMNMSSKEIATLMNISPRGVEISRYRVRKKIGMEHTEGLTEFLLSI